MDETWPSEWLRGALDLCVLRVLAAGPTYGYAVATDLEAAGLGAIKGGTLYPLLGRMEQSGLVTVEWRPGEGGPGRKYYRLTDSGRQRLAERAAGWLRFTALTRTLVADATSAPTEETVG